jgi:hypothetical protein
MSEREITELMKQACELMGVDPKQLLTLSDDQLRDVKCPQTEVS